MKLCKYITTILLSAIFISGCNTVKESLLLKKKDNTDEFLVKKKNPLILPPNFNDLPKPEKETSGGNNKDEDLDFCKLILIQMELLKVQQLLLELLLHITLT